MSTTGRGSVRSTVRVRLLATATASLAVAAALLIPADSRAQDSALRTIRDDVRLAPPPRPASPPEPAPPPREEPSDDHYGASDPDPWLDGIDPQALVVLPLLALYAAASPIWAPQAALDDDFPGRGYFLRYPYDHSPDYMKMYEGCARARNWAGRLDVEYIDNFDNLESIGGHLLLSTASRFGLEVSFSRLEENLSGGGHDQLRLGDCNLVYRFAQGPRAEFRLGLGANWLDDARRTDLGFNFTYAADFFPKKPWILSAALDWGTLGRAELFRFRTTVGVGVRRVEFYTGHEYTDIDRTQSNGLISGLRMWF